MAFIVLLAVMALMLTGLVWAGSARLGAIQFGIAQFGAVQLKAGRFEAGRAGPGAGVLAAVVGRAASWGGVWTGKARKSTEIVRIGAVHGPP